MDIDKSPDEKSILDLSHLRLGFPAVTVPPELLAARREIALLSSPLRRTSDQARFISELNNQNQLQQNNHINCKSAIQRDPFRRAFLTFCKNRDETTF